MFVRLSCLTSVISLAVDSQCQIFDSVIHEQFQRNHSLPNSSKTVVLPCTAQNLTCSQEFQPRVPPSSVQLHVSPATAISNATRCLCPFQRWQLVQGTPAQVPPPLLRALVCQLHLGGVTSVRFRRCAPQPLRFLDNCRIWSFASEMSPPRHRRALCLSVNLHVSRSRSNRRRSCSTRR